MSDAMFRVPLLRIVQCSNRLLWYRGLVGQLVPHRAWNAEDGYMSNEPSGFTNFVRTDDAEPVEVMVTAEDLTKWPYKHGQRRRFAVHHDKPVPVAMVTAAMTGQVPPYPRPEWQKAVGARVCQETCGRLGICQALDDCQDKPRIDAELAKGPTPPQPVGQSRAHSMAETLCSIAVGFVVSMVVQALVLPAFGHHITLAENFWITCIFTVASVLRGYGMRRLFNHLHTRGGRS